MIMYQDFLKFKKLEYITASNVRIPGIFLDSREDGINSTGTVLGTFQRLDECGGLNLR